MSETGHGFCTGKIILAGEHAVVYGKMALAASIGIGVKVSAYKGEQIEINEIVNKAIEVAGGDKNIQVEIESGLPIGAGLGSSAAVAAATIKAVREYLKKPLDNDELFALTMECEKIAHGNPSGLDPVTVIYGGLICYTKGKPFERLVISSPVKLLLINSGKPEESTREMVELVAKKTENIVFIEKIGEVVKQIREKLINGEEIANLLNQNGLLLEELGVVGEKAKKLSSELRLLGASVKISGAGGVKTGSGMMVVMNDNLTKIKKLLDNKQINYFETIIGEK